MHRLLVVIQRTKASTEQYARLTNFIHSLVHEWNRMRRELDIKERKTASLTSSQDGPGQTISDTGDAEHGRKLIEFV